MPLEKRRHIAEVRLVFAADSATLAEVHVQHDDVILDDGKEAIRKRAITYTLAPDAFRASAAQLLKVSEQESRTAAAQKEKTEAAWRQRHEEMKKMTAARGAAVSAASLPKSE